MNFSAVNLKERENAQQRAMEITWGLLEAWSLSMLCPATQVRFLGPVRCRPPAGSLLRPFFKNSDWTAIDSATWRKLLVFFSKSLGA